MMTESEKFMRRLRKVRKQMYEETKDMTPAERVAHINAQGRKNAKELGIEKYFVNSEQIQEETNRGTRGSNEHTEIVP